MKTAIRCILALCLGAYAAVLAAPAAAGQYAVSRQPYWAVGGLDPALSNACQTGQFNQDQSLRLTIGFVGKAGKGITGVALKGWNLRDPGNLGKPGFTYHFKNDGLTNCRVYVARNKQSRGR